MSTPECRARAQSLLWRINEPSANNCNDLFARHSPDPRDKELAWVQSIFDVAHTFASKLLGRPAGAWCASDEKAWCCRVCIWATSAEQLAHHGPRGTWIHHVHHKFSNGVCESFGTRCTEDGALASHWWWCARLSPHAHLRASATVKTRNGKDKGNGGSSAPCQWKHSSKGTKGQQASAAQSSAGHGRGRRQCSGVRRRRR